MKKVALVTFHTPLSCGAQLQAFALQEAIKDNHCLCRIINYVPHYPFDQVRLSALRRLYSGISSAVFCKRINLLKCRFAEWMEDRLELTDLITSETQLKKVSEEFDIFVCGSDQIWRLPERGYYFLDFVPNHARRVAYAPSFGNINFNEGEKSKIRSHLTCFDFLSVRENDGAIFVSNLLNKTVPAVLDPTLLWSPEFWQKYAANSLTQIPKKFVLLFSIQDTIPSFKIALKVCAKLKLPLVVVDCARRLIWHPFLNNLFDAGPAEFLRLVELADFVVTSSFHGMAFSVNYGKPFLSIRRRQAQNVNSRIQSLADILGVEGRVIYPDEALPRTVFDELDQSVFHRLAEQRSRSWHQLAKSLGAASPKL